MLMQDGGVTLITVFIFQNIYQTLSSSSASRKHGPFICLLNKRLLDVLCVYSLKSRGTAMDTQTDPHYNILAMEDRQSANKFVSVGW